MPQTITNGYRKLVAEAEARIDTLDAAAAIASHEAGSAVLVDLRDIRELDREGRIPGAFHCPRGMLEFWIDPESPYHKPVFAGDGPFVFFCAAGLRSALATRAAADMGLAPVSHIAGGFAAWRDGGGPVEPPRSREPARQDRR